MDIWSFFRVLSRRKWLMVTVTLTAVLATFFITLRLPYDYKSQATLATGITENSEVSLEDNNTANPYVINTRFSNLIELINSRRVISLLSYRLILHDLENENRFRELEPLQEDYPRDFLRQMTFLFRNKLDSMEMLAPTQNMDYAMLDILNKMKYDEKSLRENLYIERGVGSDFVQIYFVSEDPNLSAFVVNALSEEFLRYYRTNKIKRVENSLEFFTQLVRQKKAELDEKTNTLKAFKERKNVINFSAQSTNMLNRISQLENNREEETKKIVGLRQAIINIDHQLQGISSTDYGAQAGRNNQQMNVLRSRMSDMNDRYVNSGMKDQVLADSISLLRRQLNELINQSEDEGMYRPNITRQELAGMKVKNEIELETARARLNTIESELLKLQQEAYGFNENEGDIASLESDIGVAREEYLQVLDKYNTARNASLSVANRLEQVEVGEPAYEPEPSKRILLVAIAGAGSFSLCVVLIFFLEFVNMKVDTPAKFKNHVRLPLIGSLNKVKLAGFDLKTLFAGEHTDENRETFKQLLRKVRYEIETEQARSILVTSNKRGEGKTFVIISLAYALSLLGKRILIIDTNFKNNTLTKIFKPFGKTEKYLEESSAMRESNEPKLLKEAETEAQTVDHTFAGSHKEEATGQPATDRSLISQTRLPGVDLIASRGGDLSPAELFMSKNFQLLLKELENEYDYIFMEGSAMNDYSDTQELMKFADKVITVFSADSHVNQMDRETINLLKKLDGKLIGAILNKVESYNLNF